MCERSHEQTKNKKKRDGNKFENPVTGPSIFPPRPETHFKKFRRAARRQRPEKAGSGGPVNKY